MGETTMVHMPFPPSSAVMAWLDRAIHPNHGSRVTLGMDRPVKPGDDGGESVEKGRVRARHHVGGSLATVEPAP
jgi:hypothetical protein